MEEPPAQKSSEEQDDIRRAGERGIEEAENERVTENRAGTEAVTMAEAAPEAEQEAMAAGFPMGSGRRQSVLVKATDKVAPLGGKVVRRVTGAWRRLVAKRHTL